MTEERIARHASNHLDLLRLLFASLVLLSHAPELVDGNRSREILSIVTRNTQSFGEFAVAGFFALSGYLIMASWCRTPRLIPYFRNRILRIYPAFIIAFGLSVLLVGPLAATDRASYFAQFGVARYVYSVVTLSDPWFAQSFKGMHYPQVNGAMWTISYEFLCYIAVAVVGWCTRQHLKFVWMAITLVLLGAACFPGELQKLPAIGHFNMADLIRISSTFFAGGTLYLLQFKGMTRISWKIGVTALFILTLFSDRFHVAGFAVFGAMVFLSIGLAPSRLTHTHQWPDISYGTYLYGWPVLQLVIWSQPQLEPWAVFLLALIGSLACGYASWTWIEAPFMRLKTRTPRADIAI